VDTLLLILINGSQNSQHSPFRVLIASLQNMGICPCPRCLIKKIYLPGLGTIPDRQQRGHIHVSNEHHVRKIHTARKAIYHSSYAVNLKAVNELLASESIVPTMVSNAWTVISHNLANLFDLCLNHLFTVRMLSCHHSPSSISTSSLCLSLIRCTSLNWVSGR